MPTVFITGGGGIIGPGMIREFSAAGYDVAASYHRSKDRTEAALRAAEEAHGIRTLSLYGDNGRVEDILAMFRQVEEVFGGIDCMVNNAGMTFGTDLLNATEQDFDRGVSVDFRGTFFCMQQAAKNMIAHGKKGVIINISSNHQTVTFRGSLLYAACKAAVDRMTRSASVELAPYGIRVVDIVPGYTQNPGYNEKSAGTEWYDHVVSKIPLGRYAVGDEIGKAAVFLAGEGAGIITGTSLYMDGGAQNVTGVPG